MTITTGIGQRIKDKRKELGLSQTDLAVRLGLKSKSTICKIENGEDNLTQTSIIKYAKALNTTTSYLMGREDEAEKAATLNEIEGFLNSISDNPEAVKDFIEFYRKFISLPEKKRDAILSLL